jgi:hypothetical protein
MLEKPSLEPEEVSDGRYDVLEESPEESEVIEAIAATEDFSELYLTLTKCGGLEGTKRFYPAEELIELIKEGDVFRITRTAGLRDKVLSLAKEGKSI